MNIYNVIMAGGGGTRFWPISRQHMPKQLLNLSGADTLINETIDRVATLSTNENIFIVTNVVQAQALKDTVKDRCMHLNIYEEPCGRDTATAIGYSAMKIMKSHGDGIMCVYPADHYIKDKSKFIDTMHNAIELAKVSDSLITIGIKPNFPSTGYGYINYDDCTLINENGYKVINFTEKPDYKHATQFLESGNYLWNSGIFVWKVSKIIDEIKIYLPRIYEKLEEILSYSEDRNYLEILERLYPQIPSISVDYGIMEKSKDVLVIKGEFDWSDIGSWDTLGNIFTTYEDGNIKRGEILSIDTNNSIIYSDERLIATIGVSDLIIVSTKDSILICSKDRAQDVKKIIQKLKEDGKEHYL